MNRAAATSHRWSEFLARCHEAVAAARDRLQRHGHVPVTAENPYWERVGAITVPDPDGWRVVLVPTAGISA